MQIGRTVVSFAAKNTYPERPQDRYYSERLCYRVLLPELKGTAELAALNKTMGDLRKPNCEDLSNEPSDKIQNVVPVFSTHGSAAKRNQELQLQDEDMMPEGAAGEGT